MRNYFYVAVVAVAALLLVVGLRTIYAFQGPDQAPPNGSGQLAADGNKVGLGTTSPSDLFDLAKLNSAVKMIFKRVDSSISSGNTLGRISFSGTDGATEASPHVGSFIQGSASGAAWTSGQSPGNLSFYTTPIGSVSPAKRMTIYQDGLVEFKGHIEIEGGTKNSPAKGKFLQSSTNGGRAKWDYWPGDHLWGQGRAGIILANSAGECSRTVNLQELKISRGLPTVKWEGAAAACPKGWWVCSANDRGTGSCGTGTAVKIEGCRPNFYNRSTSTGAPTTLVKGRKVSTSLNAWVADAIFVRDLYRGMLINTSGEKNNVFLDNNKYGDNCNNYPVWCCANK